MRVTIFGASGGIGQQATMQALTSGHEVTAVVRDTARLDVTHPELEAVTVPGLTDPDLLVPALRGSDAVLSAVGPRGRSVGPVATTATRGILTAMESIGVRRFVAVSAAPVGAIPDNESFVNRRIILPAVRALLKNLYTDLTEMEELISRSATDWTIVRPPKLVNRPLSGRYQIAIGHNAARVYAISRADVAHAMLAALHNPATRRQLVGVGY
ncbi:NAD(P)-binding oxidoreductase [Micromonospora arborensis]|uniref:NAD(P)-dependent oxidoreductase n=1 Tax=Micromonospora arborensis TaxID=2116518 RepID=UPI0034218F81